MHTLVLYSLSEINHNQATGIVTGTVTYRVGVQASRHLIIEVAVISDAQLLSLVNMFP